MQQYSTVIKSGGFALTCPACGGTSQAEHKKKGAEKAVETCPHCKAKIEAMYEPEPDWWWDQQKVKVMESFHLKVLQGLSGQAREDFKAGLRNLGYADPEVKAALTESFKRLHPNATERELDIMVTGKVPPENKGGL
jgi:hypothetical protein